MLRQPAKIATSFVPRPWRGTNTFQEACWAWRRLPVPVIAAVHGHCLGGGLQIALAADFRFATPDSRWSVLEGKWGIIPDMSGVRSMAELVGIDVAKQLTMTAEVISGKEARELGLVTGLDADPLAAADALIRQLKRPLARPARGRQAALQRHLDGEPAAHVRPRARRAGLAAGRPQHEDRARGRDQEDPAGVPAPRPMRSR